ncbi:TonB-dependent receptor [Gilvibacter sp.]|uniref:TonB-dependent receptor n=1 Tax=Gilvibacter sp. TaxID=2729997 RepID=UPI003F4A6E17
MPVQGQQQSCSCCTKGKVLDKATNTPVAFATVNVPNTNVYTQTKEDGSFVLTDYCPDRVSISINVLGYKEANFTTTRQAGEIPTYYLEETVASLDEVTVKAEAAKEKGTETIAQSRLSKDDILSNSTQSLAVSLSKLEGVTFASTGTNVQLPIIHGLSGNRILVLNNDIKHAFQNWGSDHAPEIDMNAANGITVIKGAAGVRFGPEALSGAILVEPNPLALYNPFYGRVGAGYQTNGRGYNANAEIGAGGEHFSYFANGSYARIGDRKAPDYNLSNTGKEETAFSLGARYNIDAWDFKVYYSYIDQDLGLLRSSVTRSPDLFINSINADEPIIINPFTYDVKEPNQTTEHQLAKVGIDWRYSDGGKLHFHAGIQQNRRNEFDVRRPEEIPIINLDLVTYEYQLEWEHPDWKGFDGVIGVQYFNQNNDNNPGTLTTPFIPNYNTERVSIFLIETLEVGDDTFEAGVRFDRETNDVRGRETNQDIFRDNYTFTNFTASLGYLWNISENSSLSTNVGSAFRTPNVAELFSFGQQGYRSTFGLLRFSDDNGTLSTSDVVLLEDSDVDLERGYKLTTEYRTSSESNSHLITGYVNYIDNFVYERPIGVFGSIRGPQPAFIIDQAEALFIGLDYTWKHDFSERLSSTYGLSYLWSRNIGDDQPLIEQPPISTNLELQWEQGGFWIFDESNWGVRPSYTFEQFQAPRTVTPESLVDGTVEITSDSEIFDFIDAPQGYFLLDLLWSFQVKNLGGSITAQNVLNNSYRNYLNEFRYFADEPGINILFSLNYSF